MLLQVLATTAIVGMNPAAGAVPNTTYAQGEASAIKAQAAALEELRKARIAHADMRLRVMREPARWRDRFYCTFDAVTAAYERVIYRSWLRAHYVIAALSAAKADTERLMEGAKDAAESPKLLAARKANELIRKLTPTLLATGEWIRQRDGKLSPSARLAREIITTVERLRVRPLRVEPHKGLARLRDRFIRFQTLLARTQQHLALSVRNGLFRYGLMRGGVSCTAPAPGSRGAPRSVPRGVRPAARSGR